MKHLYILTLLILLTFQVEAQKPSPQKLMTLKSAIDTVLANNPSLKAAREKIHQLDLTTSTVRGSLYPNVEATVSALQKKDSVANGTAVMDGHSYNTYSTEVKLIQPLFRVGTFSAINSVKKDMEVGKLDSEITERDLIKAVILSYYRIVFSTRSVETLMYQQRLVKESQKVAEQHMRIGRGRRLDVLQIRTQLALQEAKIAAAKNQQQIAAANLAFLMGENIEQSFRIKSDLAIPGITEIDRAINLKEYKIPELERIELELSQIGDKKQVALGKHLPSLSLIGSYNFANYKKEELYNPLSNSWYLGLQLTIPLFSGFSSMYEQSQYSSQRLQLEFLQKNSISNFNFQQISGRKNLETAHNSILSGDEALKLATSSNEEAKKNYRYATIDLLQLLTVQQAYAQAEQTLNDEKYNYIQAVTNYFISSGQDLNKLTAILESDKQ